MFVPSFAAASAQNHAYDVPIIGLYRGTVSFGKHCSSTVVEYIIVVAKFVPVDAIVEVIEIVLVAVVAIVTCEWAKRPARSRQSRLCSLERCGCTRVVIVIAVLAAVVFVGVLSPSAMPALRSQIPVLSSQHLPEDS